jgi:small-conductance mechanosensitive channel
MTTVLEDDRLILSFVRQPEEHAAVMRQAGRRFGVRRRRNPAEAGGLALLYAIACGAGIALLFHALRIYVYTPIFDVPSYIDEGTLVFIWLVPTAVLYVLFVLYVRWLTRRRLSMLQARIRPDVTITVTVTPKGASWETAQSSIWLGWSEISDIALRNGRIEFDLESFVTYIPAAAFAGMQQQTAMLKQILGLWRAARAKQP